MNLPEQSTVLSSWKDIARYMGKGVRTVQRWERELGLPVRRPNGASQKSAVLLDRGELDTWLQTRFTARPAVKSSLRTVTDPPRSARSALREGIRTARELRYANLRLTQQIAQSLNLLVKQCDALGNQFSVTPACILAGRDGTGRDGTGRDGTGRDGTGRDGTGAEQPLIG